MSTRPLKPSDHASVKVDDARPRTPFVAVVVAVLYAAVRWYWALGGRAGLTLCDRTEDHLRTELATGCGADTAARLPFVTGIGAAALCTAVAIVAGAILLSRRRGAAVAGALAALTLIAVSFPGHLVIQIPASLDGSPTDWRDIGHRVALLATGVTLGMAALTRIPRRSPVGQPQRPARWAKIVTYATVTVPVVGYTVPHLVWMAGVPLSIDPAMLANGFHWVWWLLCAFPVVGGLLTVGLVSRWGQQLPGWVPVIGARRVPRYAALIPATLAAIALIAYGALGIGIVLLGLVDGSITRGEMAVGWAAFGTEGVFFVWGVLLAIATSGYYLTTSTPTGAQRRSG